MICLSLEEKEVFSKTPPNARYPSRTVGLLAKIAIRFGMKPSDFRTFSSIGFEASGAVAMVTGAKSGFSVLLTFFSFWLSGSKSLHKTIGYFMRSEAFARGAKTYTARNNCGAAGQPNTR